VIEALDARIAAATEALPEEERAIGPQVLRGVRGLPPGKVAEIVAAAYREDPPKLPEDGPPLTALFAVAWEDGLAAIGLLATTVREHPSEAVDLALDWAPRVDDVITADSLGWLVLGPGAALSGRVEEVLDELAALPRPEGRRIGASMALAYTPEKIEGAAAAGLREQLGLRQVRIVDQVRPDLLGPVCARFVRDAEPAVQKALRRALRAWADDDPASLVAWAPTIRGGLPRMLSDEVKRAKGRA
jgi:hypothetical protein